MEKTPMSRGLFRSTGSFGLADDFYEQAGLIELRDLENSFPLWKQRFEWGLLDSDSLIFRKLESLCPKLKNLS